MESSWKRDAALSAAPGAVAVPGREPVSGLEAVPQALRRRPITVELVGLAGVGKSHLEARLAAWFGERALAPSAAATTVVQLPDLLRALVRVLPLVAYVLRGTGSPLGERARFSLHLVAHAWREAVTVRRAPQVVLASTGWYHKLRRIRRFHHGQRSFAELPAAAKRRLFDVDLVLLVHADPATICARKLRRSGTEVTPETIARQYARSDARGQWDEYALTRRDLEEAAELHGQRFMEIDYRDDFDLERDLIPHLRRHGIA